jgi:hypothetical protein
MVGFCALAFLSGAAWSALGARDDALEELLLERAGWVLHNLEPCYIPEEYR